MTDLFSSIRSITISCAPGITPFLKRETELLGYHVTAESWTTLETEGTFTDTLRLNMMLRAASHVFLLIKKFKAGSPDDIYASVKEIQWETIVPADGYFSVHSISDHEAVKNQMFLNLRIKDAIADRFMEATKKRPDSGPAKDRTVIFLHWKGDDVSLYLDTSGESLTKHGYRLHTGRAPLQESLAAALVMATRWNGKESFVNPMCGSGTLAIEAAMMASGIYPGMVRSNYGFKHVTGYDGNLHARMLQELGARAASLPVPEIVAGDRDGLALRAARENAKRAGVERFIRLEKGDFMKTPVPAVPGVILFNPPYGERLGASAELQNTYKEIGNMMKRHCAGYRGYLFTGSRDLAKYVGLRPKSRTVFYNGSIECLLLKYELYEGKKYPPRQNDATADQNH